MAENILLRQLQPDVAGFVRRARIRRFQVVVEEEIDGEVWSITAIHTKDGSAVEIQIMVELDADGAVCILRTAEGQMATTRLDRRKLARYLPTMKDAMAELARDDHSAREGELQDWMVKVDSPTGETMTLVTRRHTTARAAAECVLAELLAAGRTLPAGTTLTCVDEQITFRLDRDGSLDDVAGQGPGGESPWALFGARCVVNP